MRVYHLKFTWRYRGLIKKKKKTRRERTNLDYFKSISDKTKRIRASFLVACFYRNLFEIVPIENTRSLIRETARHAK